MRRWKRYGLRTLTAVLRMNIGVTPGPPKFPCVARAPHEFRATRWHSFYRRSALIGKAYRPELHLALALQTAPDDPAFASGTVHQGISEKTAKTSFAELSSGTLTACHCASAWQPSRSRTGTSGDDLPRRDTMILLAPLQPTAVKRAHRSHTCERELMATTIWDRMLYTGPPIRDIDLRANRSAQLEDEKQREKSLAAQDVEACPAGLLSLCRVAKLRAPSNGRVRFRHGQLAEPLQEMGRAWSAKCNEPPFLAAIIIMKHPDDVPTYLPEVRQRDDDAVLFLENIMPGKAHLRAWLRTSTIVPHGLVSRWKESRVC